MQVIQSTHMLQPPPKQILIFYRICNLKYAEDWINGSIDGDTDVEADAVYMPILLVPEIATNFAIKRCLIPMSNLTILINCKMTLCF